MRERAVATGGCVGRVRFAGEPAAEAPPKPRGERVDVSEECWVEVDGASRALPCYVTVHFPRFGCGAMWDGKHLTRSALGFAGPDWIPRIEEALAAWTAERSEG